MTSGYSGTPLANKLSLKDGMRVYWEGLPDSVRAEIAAEGLHPPRRSTRPISSLQSEPISKPSWIGSFR